MSTNNFRFENICVVVHNSTEYYCENCETYQDDNSTCESCGSKEMSDNAISDFYDDDIVYFTDTLAEKVKGFEKYDTSHKLSKWTKNEALILGEVQIHKDNGEYYASVYATYKSGYYSGACLDYVVEYADVYEYGEHKKTKKLEKKIQSKCNAIAKVLRTLGTEVVKVAQFSNGEAIYKAVK